MIRYILLPAVLIVFSQCFDHDDLLKRAVFPPNVPDIPNEPRGHNKPLGWQRPPERPIKEYTEALNPNDFWKLHAKPHIPLVLRGYLKDSPAIKLWDDEYLAEKYGDLDILVEHKLEDRSSSSGRMRLADFLKNYNDSDMYVVSMFPSDMMHEVRAIPSILCGTFKDYTHESNLWISSGGTRSVVHYDADHNFHCLLDGRKDFIMINNNITTKTNLYFKYKNPGVGSGFSFLDPDNIDMNKFKKIAKVPWTYATLYPGDCIFIPSVYIHQVRGYGRTIAVTTLFTADIDKNFNGKDCTDEMMQKNYTMSDIDFQWTYKKGDKTIDMGYMNVHLVKAQVRDAMKDEEFTKNGKFTKKQFSYFAGTFSPYGRNVEKISKLWSDVFNFADDTVFDESSFETLSLEQWKAFCRAIEAPHGVVTNGTEPVFVKPGERRRWEEQHSEDTDVDDYMTDTERKLSMAAHIDPMFNHMSEEEKEIYIMQQQEKKAKFGLDYNPQDELLENNEDLRWRSELAWKLSDIPAEYQSSIFKGVIPAEFKDELMENIPEYLLKNFAEVFDQNKLPRVLVKFLREGESGGGESYKKEILKKLNSRNEEDNDDDDYQNDDDDDDDDYQNDDDDDDVDEFPISFQKLDKHRQKLFISGKIQFEDADKLTEVLPKKYRQYSEELLSGVLNQEILMAMMGVTKENFEETINKFKRKLHRKEEL